MKISHMIKREDFYSINERTLRVFYQNADTMIPLYVYPNLNAIITKKPSKYVKAYLYTEYQVAGRWWKRLLVHLYCVLLLNSRGLFASKKVLIPNWANSDTLIYPCNRKFRIFDFSQKTVTVIAKSDFPTDELQNEIKFRKDHRAEFVLPILRSDNKSYSETIIDGYPAARSGNAIDDYLQKAYSLWREYSAQYDRRVVGCEYAETIKKEIDNEITLLQNIGKRINYSTVEDYKQILLSQLRRIDYVPLTLSHGDLQAGNIWVERKTNKIWIIDWETCAERSVYYDQTVLFDRIRYSANLEEFASRQSNDNKTVVLAEDLLFRLKELSSLPAQFGVNDFEKYLNEVESRYV